MSVSAATSALTARYRAVRDLTVAICKPLRPEDHVVQPVVDVSPPKWHLAHTTWFFETFLLQPHLPGYRLFHPDYGYFFNSYYESVGTRVLRADRGNMTRPTTEEIMRYRAHVDAAMAALLDGDDLPESAHYVLEVGFQHEQQHQELLVTDLKWILGHNPLFPVYTETPAAPATAAAPVEWLPVAEGLHEVGHTGGDFCFDNELGAHRVFLPAFRIQSRPVTNAEYAAFVAAGGYERFDYWLAEGWEWVKQSGTRAPLYWHEVDGAWHHYTLGGGLQPVDPHAPVTHVSYFEAEAYARFRGRRLPTEFEWEVACRTHAPAPPEGANFVDTGAFHPRAGRTRQFYGDVWEWTGSAYLPYPGFQPANGALGEYNGKFMVSQMVLRGGSCATSRDHIRPTYRNFFHPDKRWQFTGIRLAEHV
ncbi:MAG: ergothioneine biosynthesis protein EgtB [Catalinimonas sp.]